VRGPSVRAVPTATGHYTKEQLVLNYVREHQPCSIEQIVAEANCNCGDGGRSRTEKLILRGRLRLDKDGLIVAAAN
jgi:hypothetical protein